MCTRVVVHVYGICVCVVSVCMCVCTCACLCGVCLQCVSVHMCACMYIRVSALSPFLSCLSVDTGESHPSPLTGTMARFGRRFLTIGNILGC